MKGYYGIVHTFSNCFSYSVLSSNSCSDALKAAVISGISPDSIVDILYLDSPKWNTMGCDNADTFEKMTNSLFDGNTLTVSYFDIIYSMQLVDPTNISNLRVEFFNKTNNTFISYIELTDSDSHYVHDRLNKALLLYHVELVDTIEQLQYNNVTLH